MAKMILVREDKWATLVITAIRVINIIVDPVGSMVKAVMIHLNKGDNTTRAVPIMMNVSVSAAKLNHLAKTNPDQTKGDRVPNNMVHSNTVHNNTVIAGTRNRIGTVTNGRRDQAAKGTATIHPAIRKMQINQ